MEGLENTRCHGLPCRLPHHHLPPAPPLPHHLLHHPLKTMTTLTWVSRRAWNLARRHIVVSRSRTPFSGSSVTTATPGITSTACRTTTTETRCCSTPMQTSTAAATEPETAESSNQSMLPLILSLCNKPNAFRHVITIKFIGTGRYVASWHSLCK